MAFKSFELHPNYEDTNYQDTDYELHSITQTTKTEALKTIKAG